MGPLGVFRLAGTACVAILLAGCAQTPLGIGAAATSPAPQMLTTQNIMGATPAVLNSEFGPPVLRRVDGNAQVWLYHNASCGLDLILYPDGSGTPRVADAVQDTGDAPGCVATLQRGMTDAALEPSPAS